MNQHRYPRIEKLLAVASFLSADGMGFLAFMLSENHDIETGPLWFIAQMLLLCATLLGIDLKAHPQPALRREWGIRSPWWGRSHTGGCSEDPSRPKGGGFE